MSSLTSSCAYEREKLLLQAIFSVKPDSLLNECWTALKCINTIFIADSFSQRMLCYHVDVFNMIRLTCPYIIYTSAVPILFGHIYFVYLNFNLDYNPYSRYYSTYIYYDHRKLQLVDDTNEMLLSDNRTYRLYINSKFSYDHPHVDVFRTYIQPLRRWLHTSTFYISNNSIYCNQSHMYQCRNSLKCISQTRLLDGIRDCYWNDDEDKQYFIGDCSSEFKFEVMGCIYVNTCILMKFHNDGQCDCPMDNDGYCADESSDYADMKYRILFQRLCDKFEGLNPIVIDGEIHTDETDCEHWPCNNLYSHCDRIWTCSNGIDEINCNSPAILDCPSNNHICLSNQTLQMICLPLEKFNDGHIDCIGAADEPTICPANSFDNIFQKFHCQLTDGSRSCLKGERLCDGIVHCVNGEDERYCTEQDINNNGHIYGSGICYGSYETYRSNLSKVFCHIYYQNIVILSKLYPKKYHTYLFSQPTVDSEINSENGIIQYYQQRCHRGLNVEVILDKTTNQRTSVCLCPPSFYGAQCQYQNQRIVLILNALVMLDSLRTSIIISISLIDDSDERNIHSNEQVIFSAGKHCRSSFYIYLLYSTRPKNSTKQYSIHIDIYDRKTLAYRGSTLKPILFSFLPVYRLNINLTIPTVRSLDQSYCSNSHCVNGRCRQYYDDVHNATFCQCHSGWSGRYCTIQYACTCSFDSICIGQMTNNRSICICPLNRMGPRCLLDNFICQNNSEEKCLNGGECVPLYEYDKQYVCICPKTHTGERCEKNQTKIILSFNKDIIVPTSIRVHFISEVDFILNQKNTMYKTISLAQHSTTIYYSYAFTTIFFEWSNNYYLSLFYKETQESIVIRKEIQAKDRCLSINELFNRTVLNYPPIRRLKYYHVPCRSKQFSYMSCFYDEKYFCMCVEHAGERVAHCIEYDHNRRYNCRGKSICENNGECYQDSEYCPTTSLCICPACFYGTFCQINTNEYSLSLDAILGYHIQPNISVSQQKIVVLISLILSMLICFAGLVNSLLTFITFKQKQARTLGCGIYLFCTSFNCLFIMILFLFKTWILIFSHIGSIENRLFLSIQCHSIDYLLRVCLTMEHWLTACVAVERAYIIIKRTHFDRNNTKSIAKKVVISLLLLLFSTNIQDPLNRSLFDEETNEEKRIWCIVNYSPVIHVVNSIVTTVYIIFPFIINLISAIIIITSSTRQQILIHKRKNYRTILFEQFQQHRNLLIAPIVLMMLDIPRLVITFRSGCLKSNGDSWLFLIGYFLSFIPSVLTFILFVLPSTVYSQLFSEAIHRYRNFIRTRT